MTIVGEPAAQGSSTIGRTRRLAVILGAGFSHCAELPLQRDLSGALLKPANNSRLERLISAAIREFLEYAFAWRSARPIPSLEDIFTMIDLSAGTGHALGPKYHSKRLRALRRLLIYRVFSILDHRYKHSDSIERLLRRILKLSPDASFVVLNWDIVLERHLESLTPRRAIKYHVNEIEWTGLVEQGPFTANIIKVHGSANWVYCDSCRQIYFDRYQKLSLHIGAGLSDDDLKLFDKDWSNDPHLASDASCPKCGTPVGPHIATFSYRKSFRTNAFMASWAAAEEALSHADTWLFVGYSLPAADYEFAHLLKTAELKRAHSNNRPVAINVVLYKDEVAQTRFEQMFGTAIGAIEQGGLEKYVTTGLPALLSQER